MHLSTFLSLTLQMSNFMTILILSLHVSLCAVWTSRNFQVTTTLIIWMKYECSFIVKKERIKKKKWKHKWQHKNFHLFIIGIWIPFSFSMSIHCIYNFHFWLFLCQKITNFTIHRKLNSKLPQGIFKFNKTNSISKTTNIYRK